MSVNCLKNTSVFCTQGLPRVLNFKTMMIWSGRMKGKNVMMKKVADMYLLLDIVDYVPGVVRGSYRWSSLGCSVSTAHTKWGSFQDI